MRLRLFDGNPKNLIFGKLQANRVCSKEHQDLALEAALSGVVLFKNSVGLLPLSKNETFSVAVIGPNANVTEMFLGNYEGVACKNVTVFQALQNYVTDTRYHQGCIDSVNCTSVAIDVAVGIAKEVDQVILVMGLDQSQEREKHDRMDLILPGQQQTLISSVAKASKKPVIMVLFCGGPVDVSFAKDDMKIGSILWVGYPGEAGGIALAQIIFGEHNPGGRLPMTWYPKIFANVPMTDMRMRPDPSTGYPGRTYRFYNGKSVYEFGYGISYSNYSYEFISGPVGNKVHLTRVSPSRAMKNLGSTPHFLVSMIKKEVCDKAKFSSVVGVQNHGKMAGKHSVLLFIRRNDKRSNGDLIKQLIGFQIVNLGVGQRGEAIFDVNPCEHFSKADKEG